MRWIGSTDSRRRSKRRLNCGWLAWLGFQPELNGCGACGETECGNWSFLLENGALICDSCRKRVGGTYFSVSQSVLHALRYIAYCPGKKEFRSLSVSRPPNSSAKSAEKYLLYHMVYSAKRP